MRLLQINTVVNTGSTGRIAEEIGQMVIEQGGESYMAFGRNGDRPSKSHKIKIGTDWDIKRHGMETRLCDRHGLASRTATNQLIKNIIEIQPDIIHLHNLHGYYLNIEVLFNYLASVEIPIVWTLHDCWAFTGHCTHFSYVDCNKWKVQCEKCPQKKEYPASYWLDNSYKNFLKKQKLFTSIKDMTIVPVSNWLAGVVNESFFSKYPIRVIYNGVDIEVFKPRNTVNLRKQYHLENKFVLLGVASVWSERKGLYDFIKLSRVLDKNERIILIGLNKQQIKLLPNNIIGIERTDDVLQLIEFYSLADVVLNLSFEETFGLTTVEGFACETPSIVYNCTASPELTSASTGFIVTQGDFSEIRRAIDTVKSNGKVVYQDACRERAVSFFNKEDRYEQYIQLYHQLLSKS